MSRAIGISAHLKLLPGRNCSFNHQNLEIFDKSGKPQVAFNYIIVLMTFSEDVIGIIRDPEFP